MLDLIERENLQIQNISPLCRGTITRKRKTKHGDEKSILDNIITCDKLNELIEGMLIYEEQNFSLMKYAAIKGKQKIVKSDNNAMFASFDLQYQNVNCKKPRRELFNLQNIECQEIFTDVTRDNLKIKKMF